MIVGGRVGALFFIVCFLSVLEIQIERFCISPPAWQMNEWKELGKNGQRGFEYTGEFWLARASFSPFLCSFLCRRVIAYLLSSSSKKKSTTTLHGGKSIFWERIPAFHFLKRDLSTVGGVLYRLKSRVLSFFFLDCRNICTKKESLTPFLLKTKNTYAIRNTRFSRQAKYSFGSVSRRPDMNVGEAMAASGNVSFRFTLRF